MKTSWTLIGAFFVCSSLAFADTGTSTTEAVSKPPVASLTDRFAVELAATMNGSLGANTKASEDDPNHPVFLSDSSLSVAGRLYFSESFALALSYDFASGVMDGGRYVAGNIENNDAEEITLRPLLLGFRYQLSSLGGSPLLRPFGEFAFGPTFATTYYGGSWSNNATTAYLSAQTTLGIDAFLSRSAHVYIGARAGYLAVNKHDLSNLQTAFVLGYLF